MLQIPPSTFSTLRRSPWLLGSALIASILLFLLLTVTAQADDGPSNDVPPSALSNPAELDASASIAPGSISGRVTDTAGHPLAVIVVELYPNDSHRSENTDFTDAQGRYVLAPLSAGLYRLRFADPNHRRYVAEYYQDAQQLTDATHILSRVMT